jgi:hypothetical protein
MPSPERARSREGRRCAAAIWMDSAKSLHNKSVRRPKDRNPSESELGRSEKPSADKEIYLKFVLTA